jgi:hypothetical protein
VVITSSNPLVFERYFVVLSPAVTLVFLLDAFALFGELPRLCSEKRARIAAMAVVAAALVLVAVSAALRGPELRGRLYEISVPYRGPVDFAIEHLRSTYPDPASLVIATNYAAHTYMYYLGSRVIVGLSLNNIRRERALEPDVVIPRRRWPPGQDELRRFLARGEFREIRLPVEDRHFNNIPAVTRTRAIPDPHRFRTPHTSDPTEQLRIFERIGPGVHSRRIRGLSRKTLVADPHSVDFEQLPGRTAEKSDRGGR